MASGKAALVAFLSSAGSVLALRQDDLGGLAGEIPLCKEVAPETFPGTCDPSASTFACYSTLDKLTASWGPVDLPWACSSPSDEGGFSKEYCQGRTPVVKDKQGQKEFTAPAGTYEGVCKLASPKKEAVPVDDTPVAELPYCEEVAAATTPGSCDTTTATRACYSTFDKFTAPWGAVPLRWACSSPDKEDEFTASKCLKRSWEIKGDGDKSFTAPAGVFEGACKFTSKSEPKAPARIDDNREQKPVKKHVVEASTQEELPECSTIAPKTYPGNCDTSTSKRACYSTQSEYQGVQVHWACSSPGEEHEISVTSCQERGWDYDQDGVKFSAPKGIFEGACKFGSEQSAGKEQTAGQTVGKVKDVKTTTTETTSSSTVSSTSTATTTKSGAEGTAPAILSLAVAILAVGLSG